MSQNQKPSTSKLTYKINYFSIPLAIIIAGAMISGAVIYSNNKNLTKNKQDSRFIEGENEKEDLAKVYPVDIDDDAIRGNPQAKVTIIEFSDYQCPFCGRAEETLKKIFSEYNEKVRLVYRDYPLDFHKNAEKAAQASECAKEQGKFWEYHDLLFEKQDEWKDKEGIIEFKKYAQNLNLNTKQFSQCLESNKYASEVKKDYNDGEKIGVSGTPTFFINGRKLVGAKSYLEFKQIIDEELTK